MVKTTLMRSANPLILNETKSPSRVDRSDGNLAWDDEIDGHA
jgi:hypothetical protein